MCVPLSLLTHSCVHPQILVWRFWKSYNAHLELGPDHEFVDPVRASPVSSLAILAVGVVVQCTDSAVRIHNEQNNSGDAESSARVYVVFFVVIYFAVTCCFMHAGARVLRSLPDKRARMMSAYLLASSFFMVLHLTAVTCFAANVHTRSEVFFGVSFFLGYVARAKRAWA